MSGTPTIIASCEQNVVRFLDNDYNIVATYSVTAILGGACWNLAGNAWVARSGGQKALDEVNPNTGAVIRTVGLAFDFGQLDENGIAIQRSTGYLVGKNSVNGNITFLDPETAAIVSEAGGSFWDFALSPQGDKFVGILNVDVGASSAFQINLYQSEDGSALATLVPAKVTIDSATDFLYPNWLPDNSIVVRANGHPFGNALGPVKRYSSAGLVLATYNVPDDLAFRYDDGIRGVAVDWSRQVAVVHWSGGTGPSPDDTGAWMLEYDLNTSMLTNRVRFAEGTDPADPGTISIRTAVTVTIPLPTPLAAQAPCAPQTQTTGGGTGKAGCNTGGHGFVSDYPPDGQFSAWVDHDDPDDGQALTGQTKLDVWIELHHKNYPAGDYTDIKRGMRELADHPDDGGRKIAGLLGVGDIEHGLGDDFEAMSVDLRFSDIDRTFRELLETEELEYDELTILAAAPTTRDDPHVMMRGLVQQPKTQSRMAFSLTAVDSLFAKYGPDGPSPEWPFWKFSDIGIDGIPSDILDQVIPILYGEVSDKGAKDLTTGHVLSKGLIPGYFAGMFDLGPLGLAPTPGRPFEQVVVDLQTSVSAGTCITDWEAVIGTPAATALQTLGTVPTTYGALEVVIGSVNIALLMETGTTAHGSSMWGCIVFGLGEWDRIIQVFGSNLGNGDPKATPDRVLLVPGTDREDMLVPDHTNWPFPNRYVSVTNPTTGREFWLTCIFVYGPILTDHLNGVVNITCNAMGRQGPDGLPISDLHQAQQAWLENDILGEWTSGPYADESDYPQFANGVAKVNSQVFKDRQAYGARIGSSRGLPAAWYVTKPRSLSDWQQEWSRTTETKWGTNNAGQCIIWGLDKFQDVTTWPAYRHVTEVFGDVMRTPGQERENTIAPAPFDWDADQERFREVLSGVQHDEAIAKYKDHIKAGEQLSTTLINTALGWGYVIGTRLTRKAFGIDYVEFTGKIGLWDLALGQGIRFTSIEGTGPAGYVNRALVVLRKRFAFQSRLVTLTCWDVDHTGAGVPLIIPAARRFLATNDIGIAPLATNDLTLAPIATR